MIQMDNPDEGGAVEFDNGLRLRFYRDRRLVVVDSDASYCEIGIGVNEQWERGSLLLWSPPAANVVVLMRRNAHSLIRISVVEESSNVIPVVRKYDELWKSKEEFIEWHGGLLLICEGGVTGLDCTGVVKWELTDLPMDFYVWSLGKGHLEVAGMNWGPTRYDLLDGRDLSLDK